MMQASQPYGWPIGHFPLKADVAMSQESGTFQIEDFSEQRWGRASVDADPTSNRMVRLYQSMNETDVVYVNLDSTR